MSKRRKIDKFYQEWHVKRAQATKNVDEEWTLPCPRPLTAPPHGRYHAVEIHSIEYFSSADIQFEGQFYAHWSISTSPRLGQLPFVTNCGDPSNLWFSRDHWIMGTEHSGQYLEENTRLKNIARYTDVFGHGKLIIGDNLFLQAHTVNLTAPAHIEFAFEYTWTSVSCDEYAQELQSQLSVG